MPFLVKFCFYSLGGLIEVNGAKLCLKQKSKDMYDMLPKLCIHLQFIS